MFCFSIGPSPMGRWAVSYAFLLLLIKSFLTFGGLFALLYVIDLVKCDRVVVPFGHHIMMVMVLLQFVDTYRNIVRKDNWPNYVHHAVCFAGYFPIYLYGSNRTVAIGVLTLLNELPGPAYQITAALKHLKLGATEMNWYALRSTYWMNILVRLPCATFMISLSCLDMYRYCTNQTELQAFDEIQPWNIFVIIFGMVVMLGLDVIWTPQLDRYAQGVAHVLAAQEDAKKDNQTIEKDCESEEDVLAKQTIFC